MNIKFYIKTDTGFELIEVISIDFDNHIANILFPNSAGGLVEVSLSRIVQLDVHPLNISK